MSFNASQIAEYKESFELFDKDASGTIPSSDLGTVVRSLGVNPTEAQLAQMRSEAGAKCTFDVFLTLLQRVMEQNNETQDEIVEAFKVFDQNGTGFISAKDLKHIMTSVGEKLTTEECDEMIKEINVVDGKISYAEFVKLLIQ